MERNFNKIINTVTDKAKKVVKTAQFIGTAGAISVAPLAVGAQNDKPVPDNSKNKIEVPNLNNNNVLENNDVIYVTDKNDPRLKAYQDSLELYNKSQEWIKNLEDMGFVPMNGRRKTHKRQDGSFYGLSYDDFTDIGDNPVDFYHGDCVKYITSIKKTPTEVTWTQRIGPPNLNKFNTYVLKKDATHLNTDYINDEISNKPRKEVEKLGYQYPEGKCPSSVVKEEVPIYDKPKIRVEYTKEKKHEDLMNGWIRTTYYDNNDKPIKVTMSDPYARTTEVVDITPTDNNHPETIVNEALKRWGTIDYSKKDEFIKVTSFGERTSK